MNLFSTHAFISRLVLIFGISVFLLLSSGALEAAPTTKAGSGWVPFRSEAASPRILFSTNEPSPPSRAPRLLTVDSVNPDNLIKRANEAIANLQLSRARHTLELLLRQDPAHVQARDLLTFVGFLEGRELSSPTPLPGSATPVLSATASLDDLLRQADQQITALNLPAARLLLDRAQKKAPTDPRPRDLLTFVEYLEGKTPAIDAGTGDSPEKTRPDIETFSGYYVRKSDSGIEESTSVLETSLDTSRWAGFSGGFVYEGRGYRDNEESADSQVIGTRLNYAYGARHLFSVSLTPEVFEDNKTVPQYGCSIHSRMKDWRLSLQSEKNTFRDTLATIQDRMERNEYAFSVSKKLTKTLELRQSLSWEKLSDGNSSFAVDGKLRLRFLPDWALDLKFYQAGYDRQEGADGESLTYWAPQTYQMVMLALGWQKRFARQWKCELETSFSGSSTKEVAGDQGNYNAGVGVMIHTGYLLPMGDIGVSYADKLYLNAREKRFNLVGNMRF
jgi:hypothetical protein